VIDIILGAGLFFIVYFKLSDPGEYSTMTEYYNDFAILSSPAECRSPRGK